LFIDGGGGGVGSGGRSRQVKDISSPPRLYILHAQFDVIYYFLDFDGPVPDNGAGSRGVEAIYGENNVEERKTARTRALGKH